MYLVIRKFSRMRTVHEAARRAESGIGKLMKEASGFRGYYIFDAGGGVAGSVTLFETREAAEAANAMTSGSPSIRSLRLPRIRL